MDSYKSFKNVPYVNGLSSSDYKGDLDEIIELDSSKNSIYTNVDSFNTAVKDYLSYRGSVDNESAGSSNVNALDVQLQLALKSNTELLAQNMQEKNEQYKKIYNLVESLKREPGYKSMVTDIINDTANGEMKHVNKDYEKLQIDLANKKRLLQVNLYTEAKMKKQNSVLRNIFLFLIGLLFVSMARKMELLGEELYAIVVGIIFAFMIIYIVYERYDIYLRDSMDFESYRFLTSPSNSLSNKQKKNINLPIHLQNDLPGYCQLEKNVKDVLDMKKKDTP